ncbi:hypothetical protein [Borrelia persica]|uniref:hypothetical protein n=1 Tax=Borrelia persica TaxID=44448 RepID=UPI0004653E64|nr:hypothetical protein [Borrelia persica]
MNSLKDLRFRLSNLIETIAVNNNRFKAANVLNGTSVVIAKDDYLNIKYNFCLFIIIVVYLFGYIVSNGVLYYTKFLS